MRKLIALNEPKIAIIGSGIAGLAAAVNARKTNSHAKITILSKENYPPYCKPSLPFIILGTGSLPDEIGMYPCEFLTSRKIRLLQGFEAQKIDTNERVIRVRDTKTNEMMQVDYDTLVLAMGGYDVVPPIEGTDLKTVFTLRTIKDALKISGAAKSGKGAVVVGAGPIALSIAEALTKRGVKTKMIIRSRMLRTLIEPDLSLIVQKRVEKAGVECLLNVEVDEIVGSNNVECISVSGKKIDTSIVIFATGIRPFVKLAGEAGVKLGRYGISTDERMRTSVSEIFAAGDCVETIDFMTRKPTYLPIGSIAAQEGSIAGVNAAGGDMHTDGFLRVQADTLFGMDITSMGHGSETAKALGIEVNVADVKSSQSCINPYYLAKKYPSKAKIVTDQDGKVVGAQMLGYRFAAQERYLLFKAIKEQMKANELEDLLKTF